MKNKKRDNWFVDYQEIPSLGVKGKRVLEDRLKYYNKQDFENKSVLDLGCNMGQMCFQSFDWKASRVVGVEYDANAIKVALEIKEKLNYDINFIIDDLDSNFFWNSIGSFDIVLFLSVIDTKELENRYGILSKACSKTKNVMYFEGHGKQPLSKYLKNIIDFTDFTQIKYLGNTPVERPFFRCSREIISSDDCVQKILKSNYKKIGVVGKSGSGKTSIQTKLNEYKTNLNIIDDLIYTNQNVKIKSEDLKNFNDFVLFDYRAIDYCNDLDVVFFVTTNENLVGKVKNKNNIVRSPFLNNYENVKEVYTVLSY